VCLGCHGYFLETATRRFTASRLTPTIWCEPLRLWPRDLAFAL
jgi:hypothetical protein